MQRAYKYKLKHGEICQNFFGRGIIEKNNIFHFKGPLKTFLTPKTLFGLRNPNFGGVILLKLFDLSIGLGVGNVKNSHFRAKSALAISKTIAQIKKINKCDPPPKLGFLRPHKVLGVKKVFRGSLK